MAVTPTPAPSTASGLCSAWVSPDEVLAWPGCSKLDPTLVAGCVGPASEILFDLSGRQWPGSGCTAYVRPTARPRNRSAAQWSTYSQFGFWPSWGMCSGDYPAYGLGLWEDGYDHAACGQPPEVELGGYPIFGIIQVKIDGQIIDPSEYRLDYNRLLVRVRATADTVSSGWPTCQDLTLPDTEVGTFSVSYLYGDQPPDAGRYAATALAAEMAKAASPGMPSRLPSRVTTIQRQGMTAVAIDSMDLIERGRTGIPEVDIWLKSVNPRQMSRRASVWSPDKPVARRTGG